MPRKILSWPDCCSLPSSKKTDKKKFKAERRRRYPEKKRKSKSYLPTVNCIKPES
jgi:hypothetical protein